DFSRGGLYRVRGDCPARTGAKMSKDIRVRLIGGPNAGDEMMWSGGPVIRVPNRCDFPSKGELEKLASETPDVADMDIHEYQLHKISFGSGHHHWYGYDADPVFAFNEMWHEYRKSERDSLGLKHD
ncbi:hypothetical protein LCGC14_3013390, partial [marine sediment metagenome]